MRSLTKTLMGIFMVAFIAICFVGTSFAYTYDSEIDPIEFSNWKVLEIVSNSPFGGFVALKNPDPNATIKEAIIEVFQNSIIAYEYTIDGKNYAYEFNNETKNYDLVKPAETPTE